MGSDLPDYAMPGSQLAHALTIHRSGKFAEAEALYRRITEQTPSDCHAWHLLGVLLMQTGRASLAVPQIEKAIAINPRFPQACNNLGAAYLALNKLDEAARSFRRALDLEPDNFDGCFNLGLTLLRLGQFADAAANLQLAARLNGNAADAHCNLGHALQALDRPEEAQASYRRAAELRPDYAMAHAGLAQIAGKLGQLEVALASSQKVAGLEPNSPVAHNNLASVLYNLGRTEDAVERYRRAVQLAPRFAAAHNNLGEALRVLERWDEATAAIEQALAVEPAFAEAHYNLGLVRYAREDFAGAALCFEHATQLKPDFADAHLNLGNAQRDLDWPAEALASYDCALAIRPNDARVHANRGNALRALQRGDEAIASYGQALTLDPGSAEAHASRAASLNELGRPDEAVADGLRAVALRPDLLQGHISLGVAYQMLRRWDDALAASRRVLDLAADDVHAHAMVLTCALHACDWSTLDRDRANLFGEARHDAADIPPFLVLSLSDDPALQLSVAAAQAGRKPPLPAIQRSPPKTRDKLNIAYLSADFRVHPVATLMVGLLERHDREKFVVHGLSAGLDDGSAMRKRVAAAFDKFIDVRALSDEALAKLLSDLEIDIAIDLGGHTEGGRLMALRGHPVPVQVSYLGYPATTGTRFIDYTFVDRFVAPPGSEQHFSEKLVFLPHCFQPNDDTRSTGAHAPARADFGLPQGAFIFCCFNNSYKFNPAVFDIWMRVLSAIPGSVLWLAQNNDWAEANLRREAHRRGVDPARLVFAGRVGDYRLHLARLSLADLFLDTWPYNAHTTASDALWAGLPVLTYAGPCLASRVAGSLLHAIGAAELVTDSPVAYEAMALKLAQSPDLLAKLRERILRNGATTPLFDTDRFRRHVEAAYLQMWERSRRGEAPSSLSVASD